MRMIEEFGVFLGKLMARIQGREFSEAVKQIESFYRDTLALDAGLIHTLTDQALIARLSQDGRLDRDNGLNLAKVLLLDADLAQRPDAGQEARVHMARVKYLLAFSLFMEVLLECEGGLPLHAETDLDVLAGKISEWELPLSLAYKLFRYQEHKGLFGKAEDALFRLRESGFPGVAREGREFYRRLASLSDAELIRGNLPRAELAEGRMHFPDPG